MLVDDSWKSISIEELKRGTGKLNLIRVVYLQIINFGQEFKFI